MLDARTTSLSRQEEMGSNMEVGGLTLDRSTYSSSMITDKKLRVCGYRSGR